jgi:hypothetical protein|tara:strand:- start:137 stop:1090 length:954 start_codon:yes stop_codon:yes gene_type:complete
MRINQRGDSIDVTGAGYHSVDRMRLSMGTAGTWSVSQSTTVPSEDYTNSFLLDCTTANGSLSAGSALMFQQKFEGQNLQDIQKGTASAKQLALQFYARSSKTGTFIVELKDMDNTRHICKAFAINVADTWELKTWIVDADTTGAFDNDTANSLELHIWLAAGTNFTSGSLATSWAAYDLTNIAVGCDNWADNTANDFYIAGLQLEIATAVTAFEKVPWDIELSRCLRYYYAAGAVQLRCGVFSSVAWAAMHGVRVSFPVLMRVAPTCTITADTYNMIADNMAVATLTTTGCECVADSLAAGTGGWQATGTLSFTAEL